MEALRAQVATVKAENAALKEELRRTEDTARLGAKHKKRRARADARQDGKRKRRDDDDGSSY